MLRKMCAVSPNERIDCVQALHYIDPKNTIINTERAKVWMNNVKSGNII